MTGEVMVMGSKEKFPIAEVLRGNLGIPRSLSAISDRRKGEEDWKIENIETVIYI